MWDELSPTVEELAHKYGTVVAAGVLARLYADVAHTEGFTDEQFAGMAVRAWSQAQRK